MYCARAEREDERRGHVLDVIVALLGGCLLDDAANNVVPLLEVLLLRTCNVHLCQFSVLTAREPGTGKTKRGCAHPVVENLLLLRGQGRVVRDGVFRLEGRLAESSDETWRVVRQSH